MIINTARPAIINEEDITSALMNKEIAGLAMDGFWEEPAPKIHTLYNLKNVIITPHMGWASTSTRQKMLSSLAEIIVNFKF